MYYNQSFVQPSHIKFFYMSDAWNVKDCRGLLLRLCLLLGKILLLYSLWLLISHLRGISIWAIWVHAEHIITILVVLIVKQKSHRPVQDADKPGAILIHI